MSVPSQESEQSSIGEKGESILHLSTILMLNFRAVPSVVFLGFHFIFGY
jgi:hypothetical protein